MSREIKFRGMVENEDGTKEFAFGLLGACEGNYTIGDMEGVGTLVCDENTIGQYTGIKDKNGKEIYEGDIVTFEDAECDAEGYHDNVFWNCGVVSYDCESMSFFFTNRQTVDMDDIYIPKDVEVIGNIYENQELIGE